MIERYSQAERKRVYRLLHAQLSWAEPDRGATSDNGHYVLLRAGRLARIPAGPKRWTLPHRRVTIPA